MWSLSMHKSDLDYVKMLQSLIDDKIIELNKKYKGVEVLCDKYTNSEYFVENIYYDMGRVRILLKVFDKKYPPTYTFEAMFFHEVQFIN